MPHILSGNYIPRFPEVETYLGSTVTCFEFPPTQRTAKASLLPGNAHVGRGGDYHHHGDPIGPDSGRFSV